MKDKLLIGIIFLLLLTLTIETAYLIKIKSEPYIKPFVSINKPNRIFQFNGQNLFKNNFHTFETDKDYIIKGYMPGMKKGNIKINLEGDSFIISGESKVSNEDSKGGFYKSATSFNSFTQTVPVPKNSDPSKAKTEYKNGYVVITIPKEFSNAKKSLI